MGRPREHDEHTRVALLEAAERLLVDTGPEGLVVRSVAADAGTTTRAVYSVFGSKRGLLEALAVRLFELLSSAIDAAPRRKDPVASLVSASVHGFRAVMLEHAELYRLVFGDVTPGLGADADVHAAATAAFGRLETLVTAAVPDATGADLRTAATSVHALTEGLAAVELRGALGDPEQAERTWKLSVAALARGLAAG